MVILENIDIDIDIDKAILQNIDIDKISNRFKFGISNRAKRGGLSRTEEDGVENVWAKTLSHATYLLNIFLLLSCYVFSFPFPGILGNDSL